MKLTIEQFLENFPNAAPNANCLEDTACPHCGNRDLFHIEVKTVMEVTDGGTDTQGDVEWEETSPTVCKDCEATGTLADFTFDGLDDAIREKREENL